LCSAQVDVLALRECRVLFIFEDLETHASRSLACQNWPRDSGDTVLGALQVFNVKTLWVKFVSCAAAVGSGLPVGPEGPMIHIGAMIGAALSQGQSTSLGFTPGLFKRFQNPKDKRDFVTAGKKWRCAVLCCAVLCCAVLCYCMKAKIHAAAH